MSRIAPSRRISVQQLDLLEDRMQAYYAAVPDYPAFHTSSQHPLEWRHVLEEVIRRNTCSHEVVSILEFGCGRSGFPTWLRNQLAVGRDSATPSITCQDVTTTNRIYLQEVADNVVISPLSEGVLPPASFDIIFSTHCLEHVARPEQLLITLKGLLKPGGSLLLFAPCYDFPFYLSPSSINMHARKKFLLSFRLLMIRLITILRGRPAFVIDTNPACLDRPFLRDADAIHWVSGYDLRLFAQRNNLAFSRLDVSHQAPSMSKQGVVDRFCKLAVHLQKPKNLFILKT